jgi:hypothetical protein
MANKNKKTSMQMKNLIILTPNATMPNHQIMSLQSYTL